MNDSDRWPTKYRSREERLERGKILSERLSKEMSGFGVQHGVRPIYFLDADTGAEQADAIEFYEKLREPDWRVFFRSSHAGCGSVGAASVSQAWPSLAMLHIYPR